MIYLSTNFATRNPSENILKIIMIGFMAILFGSGYSIAQTPVDTLWFQDWDDPSWMNTWSVTAGTWEVGMPSSGPDTTYRGAGCAATILAGNYTDGVDTRLVRHASFVVPPASENPRLRFWHWWSFHPEASFDYGRVQIKVGNGPWGSVSTNFFNNSCGKWYNAFVDLKPYADSTVQVAFLFHSRQNGANPDVSSGWYIDDVALVTGQIVGFNNFEDWENGINDWIVDYSTWQVGPPTSGPGAAYSGTNCAATILDGNYCEPRSTRLISQPLQVPGAAENPRLRFRHWWQVHPEASFDYGEVHVKTANGTWTTVSETYFNSSCSDWHHAFVDLSQFADSTIQFAFYFRSRQNGANTDVSRGWYIDDIELVTGPRIYEFLEDWESGIDDWTVDFDLWEVGTPSSGPDSAYRGNNCIGTIMDGNYCEPRDTRLISPPVVIPPAATNPRLRFWHWYNFHPEASFDYGRVQLRVGNGNWVTINTDPDRYIGSSNVWFYAFLPLTDYGDSTVQFAFYFRSRQNGANPDVSSGWYIDDVAIITDPNNSDDGNGNTNLPAEFSLAQNFPNPFNPQTNIEYQISEIGFVSLTVYDVLGRAVRTLVNERQRTGNYSVDWDGRNDSGNAVSSGLYFYRLQAGEFIQTRRMLMMK